MGKIIKKVMLNAPASTSTTSTSSGQTDVDPQRELKPIRILIVSMRICSVPINGEAAMWKDMVIKTCTTFLILSYMVTTT